MWNWLKLGLIVGVAVGLAWTVTAAFIAIQLPTKEEIMARARSLGAQDEPVPQPSSAAMPAPLPYTGECPGREVHYNIGEEKVVINPGAKCSPIIWHKGYCLRVWVRNSVNPEQRVICHSTDPVTGKERIDRLPRDVTAIAVAGSPAVITVQLVPPCYKDYSVGGLIPGCVH